MIARSPTVWFADVTIDVGSGDGVAVDDPVVNGDGLVGTVSAVTGGSAQVTLIADGASAVSAKVVPSGVQGVIKPEVGNPGNLILDFIDATKDIHKGQAVVTAGWRAQGLASHFPPNIPIGEVTRASLVEQEAHRAGARPSLRRPPQPRPRPGAHRGIARMILTPKILARLVAIVVLGVLLQLSFFSQVALFHVSPDVLPALVVSLGLLGGTMTGAVTGFSVGFLLDCLLIAAARRRLAGPARIGYLAGLFRERFEIHSPLVPPLLCMVLTLFAELGFGAVELMLGGQTDVSSLVIRDMLLKSVFAFFLGWPIYLGLRRLAAPGAGRGGRGPAAPAADGAGSLGTVYLRPDDRARPATAWRCGSPSSAASPSPSSRPLLPALDLQVLDGPQYLAEAKNNRTREYKVIAPRGEILDRNGDVLVDNRTSLALQLDTQKLPEDPAAEADGADAARRTSRTCRCARCGGRSANRKKSPPGRR